MQRMADTQVSFFSQAYEPYWSSDGRCPEYPQDLIIHLLSGASRISKVQILSHHFKIATRIDVYIGILKDPQDVLEYIAPDTPPSQDEDNMLIEFTRLGWVFSLIHELLRHHCWLIRKTCLVMFVLIITHALNFELGNSNLSRSTQTENMWDWWSGTVIAIA